MQGRARSQREGSQRGGTRSGGGAQPAPPTRYPGRNEGRRADAKTLKDGDNALTWLRVLWGRRPFLTRIAVMSMLAGALLAMLLPNRYESSTRLMPPDTQSGSQFATIAALVGASEGGFAAAAGELLGMKSPSDLFIGILRSRTLEDRLVEKFDLKRLYRKKLNTDARQLLAERTVISEDIKSGIISIDVTDTDPQRAAAMAQAYVEELNRLVNELSTSSAHRERLFLESRLATVRHELNEASNDLSQFSSKNAAIDLKEQGLAMVGAAATLMGQLIAAQSELQGLEQIYTAGNIRVRSVEARIAELRTQLQKFGGVEGADTDRSQTTVDSSYPSLRELPSLAVTYADLYRRAKTQEVVYEALTKECELARVEEAKEIPTIKVLDPARVPERKSFPPRLLIVALCTFLGFAGAAVLTLGQTKWRRLDQRDPGKVLVQEVFQTMRAGMPWAAPNGSRFQAFMHQSWIRVAHRKDVLEDSEKTR